MGSNRYNEDAEAIENHEKIKKIREIRGNRGEDWDRINQKTEEERIRQDHDDLEAYNRIFGDD